jgi:hypothetical protein
VVLKHAGGSNSVKGDYLFRTFIGNEFQNGMWGILRVGETGKDVVTVTQACGPPTMDFTVNGVNTVNPANHHMAATVTITGSGLPAIPPVPVDPMTGAWTFSSNAITTVPPTITVTSAQGGKATVATTMCPIQAGPQTPPPNTITIDVDRFRLKAPATKK